MYQEDYLNPVDPNEYDEENHVDDEFDKVKKMDRGYNFVFRKVPRRDGRLRNKKIEFYSSSGTGNRIRDAETGNYTSNLVGSKDEDLFFKVILATGECKSSNGSSTLFFSSPQHYASHMRCEVDPILINNWEQKRNRRLAELKNQKDVNVSAVEVR